MSEYLFDFYELLVENIFGSILLAIFAVGVIMTIFLLMAKVRQSFFVVWLTFYFGVMMALYLGALGMIVLFIASVISFSFPILRMIGGDR